MADDQFSELDRLLGVAPKTTSTVAPPQVEATPVPQPVQGEDQFSHIDRLLGVGRTGAEPAAKPPVSAAFPAPKPREEEGLIPTPTSKEIVPPRPSGEAVFPPKTPVPAGKPDFTDKYNTPLPPDQEAKFQEWAKTAKNANGGSILNDLKDYDWRGRFQDLEKMFPEDRAKAKAAGVHAPDTYKKPSHETFSDQSKYHGVDGFIGGHWEGDRFIPPTPPPLPPLMRGALPPPPLTPPAAPPAEREGISGFLGEIGASAMRGVGGVLKMPRGIMGAFGLKAGEGLAKTGEELERGYAPSPSVAKGITESPSLLVNLKWWASAMPSLAIQLIPIALAALGGGVVGGPVGGAYAGLAAGGLIGVSDAGQRMFEWEKEHGEEIPTEKKILIGLGAGAAGAFLPGRTLTKLVGKEGEKILASKAIEMIFEGPTGKAIAERAVRATMGGGAMAGFSVIENAFEKFGYNPDREITQGVLESLVLGTAISGIHSEIGLARERFKNIANEKERARQIDDYFGKLTLDLQEAHNDAVRVRTEYGGGKGAVIGEGPPEAKPVLDQFGRPASPDDVQAALAKQPFERNAHEKFLADQAMRGAGETIAPTERSGGPVVPGEPAPGERARTKEPTVERLQRAVDIAGDPGAAKQLHDLITANQTDLANAFRVAGGARGMPEVLERINELTDKLEETGSPTVAKQLHDYINANMGALRGYTRWPEPNRPATQAMPTAGAAAVQQARGGETPSGIPDKPLGTQGKTAESMAHEEVVPAPAPAVGEVPGDKEFRQKFGTSKGVGPEGLLTGAKRKYDLQKALERYDLRTIIRAYGGFRPDAAILKNFAPEEQKRLRLLSKKGAQGPDALFAELKANHPDQMPFKDDADFLMALVDGRAKRMLDWETYDEHIAEEAAREGHVTEDFAADNETAKREVAAEILADPAEKWPEGLTLENFWDNLEAPATEDPATIKRLYPDISDEQAQILAQNPDLLAQVAKGNWEALRQAQDMERAANRGEADQLALEGLGTKLFRVGEEAAFTRALTTENIQSRLGKYGTVEELAPESIRKDDSRGWLIRLQNKQMVFVYETKAGYLEIGDRGVGPEWEALGLGKAKGAAAEFKPTSFGGLIELARDTDPRTFDHETWHMIEHWLLNDKERTALIRDFGENEEARAMAYETWNPKEAPHTIFQKILDFFQRLVKALTGYTTGEDVFAKARSGELFGREPVERRAAEAMAQKKYRVEGEEEERTWGMAGGITGQVTGNLQAAKNWGSRVRRQLTSLFAAPRLSEEALKTHQSIAKSQAEADVEIKRMTNDFMEFAKDTQYSDPRVLEFLKLYENGKEDQITDPTLKAFGEYFRREERRQMELMQALGRAPKEIANYIDHIWAPNEARERIINAIVAQTAGRSMTGPDYFFLLRSIVDIPTGMREHGLVPKHASVAESVVVGRAAREISIAATKRINDLQTNGYVKVVKNLDQIPEGWRQLPRGYGEIWAKIKRRGGMMIPEQAEEEALPLGGGGRDAEGNIIPGEERMGYEQVPGVNAWSRVGYRIAPEDVVIQFENFLGRGLRGNDLYEIYQGSIHAIRTFQMALSGFHAMFEGLNSMSQKVGMGLADAVGGLFTGDWRRMGKGISVVATAPLAPIEDIRIGLKMNKALLQGGMTGASNDPHIAVARILVGGGVRIEAETKLSKILTKHFQEAWKVGFGHPVMMGKEILRGLSSGIMDFIVPFAKNGSTYRSYLNEVARWERENPGRTMSNEQAIAIAYECRQTSDFLFGRMAMDNVGMNATVKSLLAGAIQFPTWQMGTAGAGFRAVRGASTILLKARDLIQGKEVRDLSIQDRQALQYTAGLLFTVGMVGGLMHYFFTGNKPEKLEDFFFPETGEIRPNGAPERLQLPSYLKDAMGITRHPWQTVSAKLAAPIHMITDLIQNKDYWGTQIYEPQDWLVGTKGLDIMKYMGKSAMPFVVQTYQKGEQQTPIRAGMSFLGIRPVPREIANTAAQNVIDEYNQLMRAQVTTHEAKAMKDLKTELTKLAQGGDTAGFADKAKEAVKEGKLTRQQIKSIEEESKAPPGLGRFAALPLEWSLRVMDKASDHEKEIWTPVFLKKVMTSKPELLIRNREALVPVLEEMGLKQAANLVKTLTMPEEATAFDLTGLGVLRPTRPMAGIADLDESVADELEKKIQKMEFPARPKSLMSDRIKKLSPFWALGG